MRISDWSSDVCSSDLIRARLVEQVTGMVRWRESVAAMADAGVDEFAEIGGKVLGAMVKRIAPDAKISSLVSISDIEAFVAALYITASPACGGRRSEERRGGTEGVSTCRCRWSPYH